MNPADRHLESNDSRYHGEQHHLGRTLVCESELTIILKQHPCLYGPRKTERCSGSDKSRFLSPKLHKRSEVGIFQRKQLKWPGVTISLFLATQNFPVANT